MLLYMSRSHDMFLIPFRLDSEEDREPDKWQLLHSKTDSPAPVEGHHYNNNESTKTDEPNTSQPGPTDCKSHKEERKSACIFLCIFRLLSLMILLFSPHSVRQQSLECN